MDIFSSLFNPILSAIQPHSSSTFKQHDTHLHHHNRHHHYKHHGKNGTTSHLDVVNQVLPNFHNSSASTSSRYPKSPPETMTDPVIHETMHAADIIMNDLPEYDSQNYCTCADQSKCYDESKCGGDECCYYLLY